MGEKKIRCQFVFRNSVKKLGETRLSKFSKYIHTHMYSGADTLFNEHQNQHFSRSCLQDQNVQLEHTPKGIENRRVLNQILDTYN